MLQKIQVSHCVLIVYLFELALANLLKMNINLQENRYSNPKFRLYANTNYFLRIICIALRILLVRDSKNSFWEPLTRLVYTMSWTAVQTITQISPTRREA